MSITIDGREVGPNCPPYVIGEMSANHNGSLDRALELLDAIHGAGADAVKLQTYSADTITLDCRSPEFRVSGGLWDGEYLYDLYSKAAMPWDWHEPLFARARELGITIFSSPFDSTAVDFLQELNAPAYKIASFECIDLPLIKRVAATGKPLIISTGMANAREIEEAVQAAKDGGCNEMAVLHCVSGYPAPASEYNLRTISDIASKFDVCAGLSDHTVDNHSAIASVALGACIIEKHVTIDRNGGGPDDSFSLEPQDLKDLCVGVKTAWDALGMVNYSEKGSEAANISLRRSLYFVSDKKSGEVVSEQDVRSVRPGYGLPPRDLEQILGRRLVKDVEYATPVSWDYFGK